MATAGPTELISPTVERRKFGIHPAFIKSVIHEQAGSLVKAFAELVMNAVDAGATAIELTIDRAGKFELKDNGRGFSSRAEIERYFETFGAPRDEEEAGRAHYGCFRIGRGQIMSFASTNWRSGEYEMRVDLDAGGEGYDLVRHADLQPGCVIAGQVYKTHQGIGGYTLIQEYFHGYNSDIRYSEFSQMIRFVPVPVFVNGTQVNVLPETATWSEEDEHAWYRFERNRSILVVYNRGVRVCELDAGAFGTGGEVCSKLPLTLNMARNAIIPHKCEVWRNIDRALRSHFSLQLNRVKKLTVTEARNLLRSVLSDKLHIDYDTRAKLRKIRFISDIFGDLKSPMDMLMSERFTLFDGQNTGIAERIQREGIATVIMPDLIHQSGVELNEDYVQCIILKLRQNLGIAYGVGCVFLPFSKLVHDFSDTSNFIEDAELDPEELLVIQILRHLNDQIASMALGKNYVSRKIVAGTADTMNAWTDGQSYIAVNRTQLKGIRGKGYGAGPARLIALMVHADGA